MVQHPLTLADQVAWQAAKLPKDSPYRTVIKCDPKPEPPPGEAAARTRQLLAELEKLQAVHPLLQSLDEATDNSVKNLCETPETSEQVRDWFRMDQETYEPDQQYRRSAQCHNVD